MSDHKGDASLLEKDVRDGRTAMPDLIAALRQAELADPDTMPWLLHANAQRLLAQPAALWAGREAALKRLERLGREFAHGCDKLYARPSDPALELGARLSPAQLFEMFAAMKAVPQRKLVLRDLAEYAPLYAEFALATADQLDARIKAQTNECRKDIGRLQHEIDALAVKLRDTGAFEDMDDTLHRLEQAVLLHGPDKVGRWALFNAGFLHIRKGAVKLSLAERFQESIACEDDEVGMELRPRSMSRMSKSQVRGLAWLWRNPEGRDQLRQIANLFDAQEQRRHKADETLTQLNTSWEFFGSLAAEAREVAGKADALHRQRNPRPVYAPPAPPPPARPVRRLALKVA